MSGVLTSPSLRRDRAVRRIRADWRSLTGGAGRRDPDRRTLIACSGGADSAALAIALADRHVTIGHVVHDMRAPEVAAADRDAARTLADRLGLGFVESHVAIGDGNVEAAARSARYGALAELAASTGCPFIATAHHADDELENVLMGLLRGAGPGGMGGIRRRRELGDRVIIRPMLSVERADAERICHLADWTWREDLTNLDCARLRAGVRHEVVPILKQIRPHAARHAATTAMLLRDAAGVIEDRLDGLWEAGDPVTMSRERLSAERTVVIGAYLRRAIDHLQDGRRRDRMGWTAVGPAVEAVGDGDPSPRRFTLAGVEIVIDKREVRVQRSAS